MSILDGMYWEDQMRQAEQLRKDKEIKQKEQSKFNERMPCKKCNISDICIHAFSIKCDSYNANLFDIEISCKRYNPK